VNRKRITVWLFLFLLLSTLASAQPLTKSDLEVLATKLSSLETTVNEVDKRLTRLETKVDEMDKRLTNKVEELDKRLTARIDLLFWAIGALIAVVLAVIALPQLLGYLQEKRARADFQKRIEELEQRLEQQQQEIEVLKSQRIVAPS
jgi:beta-lactamase regulating signal transducer with metallopeptidase domain